MVEEKGEGDKEVKEDKEISHKLNEVVKIIDDRRKASCISPASYSFADRLKNRS